MLLAFALHRSVSSMWDQTPAVGLPPKSSFQHHNATSAPDPVEVLQQFDLVVTADAFVPDRGTNAPHVGARVEARLVIALDEAVAIGA